MRLKAEKSQIQFSKKLRSCESPELTRLSNQINDLKRKIANVQAKQSQKSQKLVTLSSPTKPTSKPSTKSRARKEQTTKNTSNEKREEDEASEAENEILRRVEQFQQQFHQHASRVHEFIKKLKLQLKVLEDGILQKLRQIKDDITERVDKDINQFIKCVKKYQSSGHPDSLQTILLLKQEIKVKLSYGGERIDDHLLHLQLQIQSVTQSITSVPPPTLSLSKSQVVIPQKRSEPPSLNSPPELSHHPRSPKEQRLSLSKSTTKMQSQKTPNILYHLQEQKKQYNSTKLLLKL